MHAEALDWVARHATTGPVTVLDIGGRDVNGTCRSLFPGATVYTVLDIADDPSVDVVADAASWVPDREYDVVVCTEVFEHTSEWPAVCLTAFKACAPGGRFIATMAGPGRPVHSGVTARTRLYPGEHYENVRPEDLVRVLESCGWQDVHVDQRRSPADVRSVAVKPAVTYGAR